MPDARMMALAVALSASAIAICQPALAEDSHATVADSLADNLVGQASLDGEKVTGVRNRSECVTEFTTAAARIGVDWSEINDPQISYDGRYMILPVQHDGTASYLRVPRGPNANRVRSSFTLLYLDCHPN